jgi:hypothetical protein
MGTPGVIPPPPPPPLPDWSATISADAVHTVLLSAAAHRNVDHHLLFQNTAVGDIPRKANAKARLQIKHFGSLYRESQLHYLSSREDVRYIALPVIVE